MNPSVCTVENNWNFENTVTSIPVKFFIFLYFIYQFILSCRMCKWRFAYINWWLPGSLIFGYLTEKDRIKKATTRRQASSHAQMKNYELPDYGLFQMIHECQDKRFVYKAKNRNRPFRNFPKPKPSNFLESKRIVSKNKQLFKLWYWKKSEDYWLEIWRKGFLGKSGKTSFSNFASFFCIQVLMIILWKSGWSIWWTCAFKDAQTRSLFKLFNSATPTWAKVDTLGFNFSNLTLF